MQHSHISINGLSELRNFSLFVSQRFIRIVEEFTFSDNGEKLMAYARYRPATAAATSIVNAQPITQVSEWIDFVHLHHIE